MSELLQDPQLATFARLVLALLLGGIIGIERQWRQRAAGLRTNTLVCLGAAAFVDLGQNLGGYANVQVVAYVVSGVGFLGAGAIIKDGAGIRGLNTAATLWCSAAVGACAGTGQWLTSLFVTALLMVINLGFRPISRFIDKHSITQDQNVVYRIHVVCADTHEAQMRTTLLAHLAERPLTLRQLRTEDGSEPHEISLHAEIEAPERDRFMIEDLVQALRRDESVTSVEYGEGSSEVE
ncbi:MAG TPA: MgtC/SapB family protein [Bryobacteraceae bacterium]|nr:MgtC/SapB family protein [Bryobacteraceae bacterium]